MAKWPYNTTRWQRMRRNHLRTEPLCRWCDKPTPATVVDHIKPHRGDARLAFDATNLQSLCEHHHNSDKRFEDINGYSRQVGADGWPVDPRHPANRA
jgi:5-methylcytosine-specific restriction endonuclease McrA